MSEREESLKFELELEPAAHRLRCFARGETRAGRHRTGAAIKRRREERKRRKSHSSAEKRGEKSGPLNELQKFRDSLMEPARAIRGT